MSIAHLLEDFGIRIGLRQSRDITTVSEDMRESLRLDAYEDGYKAGWEDAVDANASEKQQIAADLAQNLRDLSFTYQEACSQVTRSMEEVFDGLSQSFLPSLAQHAFWPKVAEEIKGLSAQTGEGRFLLHVAPENIKVAKSLGSMMQGVQVSFREDPSLTSGQVVIGTEASEVSVDFDTLLEEAQAALRTLTHTYEKELTHG